MRIKLLLFLTFLFCSVHHVLAENSISFGQDIAYSAATYGDKSGKLSIQEAVKLDKFTPNDKSVINFGIDDATYWIKIKVTDRTALKDVVLFIDQARLETAEFYVVKSDGSISKKEINANFTKKFNLSQKLFVYEIPSNFNVEKDFIYIKLKSKELLVIPIHIYNEGSIITTFLIRDMTFGFYTGIMVVMFLYNLFLFFSVRDKSYIYYVVYICLVWLSQISIQGYTVKYFWPYKSWLDDNSVVLFSLLAVVFTTIFTQSFLNTKIYTPKAHKYINIYIVLAVADIILLISGQRQGAFIIMQFLTFVGAIIALSLAYYVYFKKHFNPAGYYLFAWSILLVGAILFIMKDYGILPYNNFTIYLLQITSSIEVMLLSFALADKINFFKRENEHAQAQALNASLENQKLIREQNIVLEKKVEERTEELQSAVSTLNVTLNNLKDTQSQLVDAEKMAALGQLTAGIAHEINNPINFVTSNIKPLELDINDLKEIITRYEEIDFDQDIRAQIEEIENFKKQIDINFVNNEISSLLSGISEGAKRTAEIIRSLRNFSRVDETDMKPIDLNEGLQSTLVLVRNNLPDNLTVIKEFGNLPKVECLPGKINQVFMNLVSNAIQAIKTKEVQRDEEFLTIKSWYIDQQVKISIKDSGIGMTEEVKHRIFEPFFTTKDIGEGTGLGLSIVFSIIEKHKGHIEVLSKVGEGTEFILTLNVNPQ
ncbi:MAG: 7TM diverse intracellular signaling domain-containing protein [Pedobacter sp.]|nr:7TM diverse intracellular signaling domain-containing protein [Pedobacter sp.]MDQ8052384.1 7TM diverse intracellular signaling domain-containing protein [Pedobacter sp.]